MMIILLVVLLSSSIVMGTSPFVAEIRPFAFNFAPKGWALCNGQLLPITQNTALFSLLGTNFGGDGKSTFGLPNLQGSFAFGAGQGAGLTLRQLGETGGEEQVTLLTSQMPAHTHTQWASSGNATTNIASKNVFAKTTTVNTYTSSGSANGAVSSQTIGVAGSSSPHDNLSPYLVCLYNLKIIHLHDKFD